MLVTNKHNLPEPIYRALLGESLGLERKFKFTPKHVGLTKLLMPPQIALLMARHDDEIEEDASDRAWALDGIADHKVLEDTNMWNVIKEVPMSLTLDNWTIYMRLDLYHPFTLYDYKRTSVWSYIFGGRDEWEQQLNCYAYAARCNFALKIDRLRSILRFRDWQKNKAKTDKKYPPIPLHIVDVPIWSDNQSSDFLRNRISIYKKALESPDEELPPCSREDRWVRDTTWAVMRKGRKSALRVLNSKKEAEDWMIINLTSPTGIYIEERPGQSVRCEEYCAARPFCRQYKEEISAK